VSFLKAGYSPEVNPLFSNSRILPHARTYLRRNNPLHPLDSVCESRTTIVASGSTSPRQTDGFMP
jgi:hypothetical protein